MTYNLKLWKGLEIDNYFVKEKFFYEKNLVLANLNSVNIIKIKLFYNYLSQYSWLKNYEQITSFFYSNAFPKLDISLVNKTN